MCVIVIVVVAEQNKKEMHGGLNVRHEKLVKRIEQAKKQAN